MVESRIKVFLMCGAYYTNFDYPKPFAKINGERLLDRTLRLLHGCDVTICCNAEDSEFDEYEPLRADFTFDYVKQSGYYLDMFDNVPYSKPCIYLFGDVYYTENAIRMILDRYRATDRNIFICNAYPFNEQHLRQGEPFGWIVKDQKEFRCAISLCKKLQDRKVVDHANGIASNWELAHLINGLGINEFDLRKSDCLVIDDETIDVDDPTAIEKVQDRVNHV